jgi:hypothetical protein
MYELLDEYFRDKDMHKNIDENKYPSRLGDLGTKNSFYHMFMMFQYDLLPHGNLAHCWRLGVGFCVKNPS